MVAPPPSCPSAYEAEGLGMVAPPRSCPSADEAEGREQWLPHFAAQVRMVLRGRGREGGPASACVFVSLLGLPS